MFGFEKAIIRDMFVRWGMEERWCYFDTDEVKWALEYVLGDDWVVDIDDTRKCWAWLRCRSQNRTYGLEDLPEETKELVDKAIEMMEENGIEKVSWSQRKWERMWDEYLCEQGLCERFGCSVEDRLLCHAPAQEEIQVSPKAWLFI